MLDPRYKTLHEQFSNNARVWADRPALVDEEEVLSYRDVDDLSQSLAEALRSVVRPGERLVAMRMSRTRFAPVGIIGILRADCGYLPIDPDYPEPRQELLLEDADARLLVTDAVRPGEREIGSVGPFTIVDLGRDGIPDVIDDLAYVIYTSGSTGRPKGCLVSHSNVLSLFRGCTELFEFGPDDVWTISHSFSFDYSVWEMWGALLTGGSAVVLPKRVTMDPDELITLLARENVTVLSQTPANFGILVRALSGNRHPLGSLRYVTLGGEALRPDDVLAWRSLDCAPSAELVNMYGITETTVIVTACRLDEQVCRSAASGRTPIGKPLAHLRVSLRDEQGMPVADGQPGEMWVAGSGVTRGYLGRADLTAERFVSDDLDGVDQSYYRSGDWAVRDEDGNLHFIGRQDAQVKLRGFRVELGEIEAVIAALSGVRAVACDVERSTAGHGVLVAHVVLEPDRTMTQREIRHHAATQLPAHMRPNRIHTCTRIPLTDNGKLDRSALRSSR
ncbi:amino acid adenylation domain-containing protein [Saccharopolyspora sp. 5N708]|uniref:amino acid adenylation domain-containing protein n=1 Tax=Saccharopolyspora sp. 5N708 TaxID=3457424 RepID=UPI003FD4FAD6